MEATGVVERLDNGHYHLVRAILTPRDLSDILGVQMRNLSFFIKNIVHNLKLHRDGGDPQQTWFETNVGRAEIKRSRYHQVRKELRDHARAAADKALQIIEEQGNLGETECDMLTVGFYTYGQQLEDKR